MQLIISNRFNPITIDKPTIATTLLLEIVNHGVTINTRKYTPNKTTQKVDLKASNSAPESSVAQTNNIGIDIADKDINGGFKN